jgi:hypothetical protein
MATINISEETKEKFKKLKLKFQADIRESISEDKFVDKLLNHFRDVGVLY